MEEMKSLPYPSLFSLSLQELELIFSFEKASSLVQWEGNRGKKLKKNKLGITDMRNGGKKRGDLNGWRMEIAVWERNI